MKFLHLSDLHIGRKLNGFSLLEDQKHILNQTLDIIDEYSPDAVIVAGDVYDSATPPVDAVMELDRFLTRVLDKNKLLFIVSGNHDSAERLSFGSDIMKPQGLYIEGVFRGAPSSFEFTDKYGKVCVHMLPFIKPAYINAFFGVKTETFDEAVSFAVSKAETDKNDRNILIAHQFVTASGISPERSESETKYVGGLDNVDYSVFERFDYVALGHLHSPQAIGRDTVVYGGSPLKYSVSERFQRKYAVIADVREKGEVLLERIAFEPLRDLRQIKGTLEELLKQPTNDDYVSAILTGGERHLEPYKRLRAVYRNCISVEYEDEREAGDAFANYAPAGDISQKSHIEIFEQFYNDLNGRMFSNTAKSYLTAVLDEVAGGEGAK